MLPQNFSWVIWLYNLLITIVIKVSEYSHFENFHDLQWWWQLKFSFVLYCLSHCTPTKQKKAFSEHFSQLSICTKKVFPFFNPKIQQCELSRQPHPFEKATLFSCVASKECCPRKRKSFVNRWSKGKKEKRDFYPQHRKEYHAIKKPLYSGQKFGDFSSALKSISSGEEFMKASER